MIHLVPMTAAEFDAFCDREVPAYASEKVINGTWPEHESLALAVAAFDELLPEGLLTKRHYFYTIRSVLTGEHLGDIWLADDAANFPRSGFIYGLHIVETHRRQGVAQAAMRAVEMVAQSLGFDTLRLHVFGRNREAISLYQKLGYAVTDLNMVKCLQ